MYRIRIVDEVFGAGGRGSNGTVLSPDSAVIGRGNRKTIIAEKVERLKVPDDLDIVIGFFIPDSFFSIKDNTAWINRNFPIRSTEDLKVGELEPLSVLKSMSDWTKFLRIYLFLDNTE
ncbi:hypothetical protein, partial [Desulfurobacterium sp.]|uniref:hypothetical protein n=1 Tax=Desulfurobacterium sp. TaxID=2004706 RepID=UPI00261CF204